MPSYREVAVPSPSRPPRFPSQPSEPPSGTFVCLSSSFFARTLHCQPPPVSSLLAGIFQVSRRVEPPVGTFVCASSSLSVWNIGTSRFHQRYLSNAPVINSPSFVPRKGEFKDISRGGNKAPFLPAECLWLSEGLGCNNKMLPPITVCSPEYQNAFADNRRFPKVSLTIMLCFNLQIILTGDEKFPLAFGCECLLPSVRQRGCYQLTRCLFKYLLFFSV